MGLFKMETVNHLKNIDHQPVTGVEDLDIHFAYGEKLSTISPLIENLNDGQSIYFMTDGAWSNIDIISKLLPLIGRCSIDFCTWSISTDAIRKFTEWQEKGLIAELNVLLDQGIRNRKPEIYQQATAAFKSLSLLKCHAKVCVLQNENYSFCIIGSANFTNNPRKEAGLIIRHKNIADQNINWIRKEIENA
ncbi:phospholipase D-like domain-containing protein [Pedobacter sp. Leaf250]|uniref:phospholipase D-like domain-containing protein n=1 Tax=Pedobacter sp. Leaf250 TaxID=2876559 RepID=UPI001E523951|nr:phospholipase D-like domain-containing protein [Pedobacter sp. Leaf250]